MGTKLGLFTFLIRFTFTRLVERHMIPSHHVEVKSKANFHEQQNLILPDQATTRNKTVYVQSMSPASPTGMLCAKVWLYSLDMQDVLGPFELTTGQLFQVIVDERPWGIYSEVSLELFMDVWIDWGVDGRIPETDKVVMAG
jgi:hypothetical protein